MAESSSSNLLDWTITNAPPADELLHAPDSSSSPRRTLTRHHNISVRLWLIVGSLIAVVIAELWVFSAERTSPRSTHRKGNRFIPGLERRHWPCIMGGERVRDFLPR